MRGGNRRGREARVIGPDDFGWGRAVAATLRHSSLPFGETLIATPLTEAPPLGTRDRLSLAGQFAAHQALLQFAGIADGDVDASDWAIVPKRGSDVRLIRIAARASAGESAPPVLTLAQQFAELTGAHLDVLRQSWARAEAVYVEAFRRLSGDVAADLRWLRAAAHGLIASPGPEALQALQGVNGYDDMACIDSITRFAPDAVILRGASPLARYSALAALGTFTGSETAVAEQVVALQRRLFAVADADLFDEASRRVVGLLQRLGGAAWLVPGAEPSLPPSRPFLVAPRITARKALDERSLDLAAFVESDAFAAWLEHGELPAAASPLPSLVEPARSYVGALALLGTRIPRELATRFLHDFLFSGALEELVVPGVTSVDDEAFVFATEALRAQAATLIPVASRPSLCRVAAQRTEGIAAARLWVDAGEPARAAEALERVAWTSSEDLVSTLHRMPRSVLTPALATRYANALIDCGRYRDARDVAASLTGDEQELVLARVERRTGDYASALTRVQTLHGFEAAILHGELLRLLDRHADAARVFAACVPQDEEQTLRLTYERSILHEAHSHDLHPSSQHYLAARLATYRAAAPDEASRWAAISLERARCTIERVDAWLDRMYAAFVAGRWIEARHLGLEALQVVEETQGDRAAGGILFTLAYLAADDGQWAQASQLLARLQQYYRGTSDETRLRELQLITAHLAFSRGRFADARREAMALLQSHPAHEQVREAAALILDELDLLEHHRRPLRSTGRTNNVELTARHEAIRRGLPLEGTHPLKRFRAALAHNDRALAQRLAHELHLDFEETLAIEDTELRILRAAAIREFPFTAHDFDLPWCYATRNRLGQWHVIGTRTASPQELEQAQGEWMQCSDHELLWFDGFDTWSREAQQAVAALFRTKAEHHRLRRVVEQEERTPHRADAIDGLVGDSPAMREVHALISRVARRDVPVCILGESGTGKELVARAIHRNSTRRQKLFTAVNCAALPENLIESELFGHVRGAFTGADRDRAGLIETTDGGTLFLDEIGEMPLPAQAKLLRFLQEGEFRRVGDTTNRTADVRIVSATNRKLERAVEEGEFREDLYYRVRGVELGLPPLRDRAADIPILALHFLAAEHAKHRGGASALSSEVEAVFAAYGWPGNIRELQNTIRAAHAMAGDARELALEHLPQRLRNTIPTRTVAGSYQDAVTRFRRDLIEKSLVQAHGNQNQAASLLKMSRQALAYQIRELGIMVKKQ